MNQTTTFERVHVWDRFVRVFHWALVICILLNFFVLEEGEPPHEWAGYLAVGLVLLRIVWGFVGSQHARFSDFFPTPTRLRRHVSALLSGHHPEYVGHNPLGALMMLALMSLVVLLGVTGWMQGLDAFWGEEWLQELHEELAEALLLAALAHAAAALIMGRLERVRLIRAMITGVKERL